MKICKSALLVFSLKYAQCFKYFLAFQLAPSEVYTIGLRFAAGVRKPGKHNVHVFIDDSESKNEETFLIIVNYVWLDSCTVFQTTF